MSNTIITSYTDISGKQNKSGKQMVVVVNKDGTLSVEKEVLQSLLHENKYENTTVSMVHIKDDVRRQDLDESMLDDGGAPHINLTVDTFYESTANHNETYHTENEDDYLSDAELRESFLKSFSNDHCYTSLSGDHSQQIAYANKFNEKVQNPPAVAQQRPQIPLSKKITILENKVLEKGKKHISILPGNKKTIFRGVDALKRTITASPTVAHVTPSPQAGENKKNLADQKTDGGISDQEDSSSDYQQDDHDSDSDYKNLSKRKPAGKQIKQKLLSKNVKKLLNRKIEHKRSLITEKTQAEGNLRQDKPKTYKVKSFIVTNPRKIITGKLKKSILLKSENAKALSNKPNQNAAMKLKEAESSVEPKHDTKPEAVKVFKPSAKKEKKAPAHVAALLNDMTSLFSTPDVPRRISTEKQTHRSDKSLLKKSDKEDGELPTTPTSAHDKTSMSKAKAFRADAKTYSNTSARLQPKESKDSTVVNRNEPLLEYPPILEGECLTRLLQESIAAELGALEQGSVPDKQENQALMGSGIHAPLSPGLDLLGELHPEEEGLTEDLLMHVAQLVESSENLQEVIDKQVLGKTSQPTEPQPVQIPAVQPELYLDKSLLLTPTTPKKEPIQIMRSNGRIITLPPIEAPATRASKRKNLLNTAVADSPLVARSSVKPPAKAEPPSPAVTPVIINKASNQQSAKKQPVKAPLLSEPAIVQTPQIKDDGMESDESLNSEDDPDRLWCICKQPHNNRFMICCDMCEDWFHGKCVNITKVMGQEMEEKGVEWRCPNCSKQKTPKTAEKRKSTEARAERNASEATSSSAANTSCIVCKKAARASSIYCSDACILKHAQESLQVATPPSPATPKAKTLSLIKTRPDTRVIVYERKTGKCLGGSDAPTAANLKAWLQEHPTYEVVQPGTMPANRQPVNVNKNRSKVQSILKIGSDKHIILMQPPNKNPGVTNKAVKAPAATSSPQTPKQAPAKAAPKTPSPRNTTPKQPQLKSPTSTSQKKDDPPPKTFSAQPIRENVRKSLREQMTIRMAESKGAKFTAEEINKFVIDTELELHDLFKDTDAKYKAKYRSLVFNLRDRKNLTLWEKICDRSISPKRLVHLTPEELASQELADWRDKEVKHQLELIKKSELDLLACNKTYVLKTHKGEEVIENQKIDTTELDPNVSVEDLVTALNKTSDTSEGPGSRPASPTTSSHHSSHHKHSKDSKSRHKSSSKDHSSKSKRSSAKHSSREKQSTGRSHRRKSSKDSHRKEDKAGDESKHHSGKSRKSSSHHDSRRSKSKSRRKDSPEHKSHSHSKSREDSKTRSLSKEHDRLESSSLRERHSHRLLSREDSYKGSTRSSHSDTKDDIKSEHKSSERRKSSVSESVFEDKYKMEIDEKNMEDMSDLLLPAENITSDIKDMPISPDSEEKVLNAGAESDQEPSSTVDSIWHGSISMIDVAKFNITAHEISGQCHEITHEFPSELEIVGRISPAIVWDYITKMRKQGYKDILLLKLAPADDVEKIQYTTFFTYLNTRNRLGVVKSSNGSVKDFYILPLSSHSPLPPALLSLQGSGFEPSKQHLLLGIIVRQRRKRSIHSGGHLQAPKVAKLGDGADGSYTPPQGRSYTPPSSPKRHAASAISSMPLPSFLPSLSSTVKDKIAASLAAADDDEPYTPGGSDSGSLDRSPNSPSDDTALPIKTELQKKMEELNRKIEEQKKQIMHMSGSVLTEPLMDEPYSPSKPMSPSTSAAPLQTLSSISLPSNLHEILASIQKQTKPASEDVDPAMSSGYVPTAITGAVSTTYYSETMSSDVDMRIPPPAFNKPPDTNTSKLSTLSEAELLSMVPDEELLPPINKPSGMVFPPLPPLPLPIMNVPPPPYKKPSLQMKQPPPPGMEDDDC